jgi:hypothetical protein
MKIIITITITIVISVHGVGNVMMFHGNYTTISQTDRLLVATMHIRGKRSLVDSFARWDAEVTVALLLLLLLLQ